MKHYYRYSMTGFARTNNIVPCDTQRDGLLFTLGFCFLCLFYFVQSQKKNNWIIPRRMNEKIFKQSYNNVPDIQNVLFYHYISNIVCRHVAEYGTFNMLYRRLGKCFDKMFSTLLNDKISTCGTSEFDSFC